MRVARKVHFPPRPGDDGELMTAWQHGTVLAQTGDPAPAFLVRWDSGEERWQTPEQIQVIQ